MDLHQKQCDKGAIVFKWGEAIEVWFCADLWQQCKPPLLLS